MLRFEPGNYAIQVSSAITITSCSLRPKRAATTLYTCSDGNVLLSFVSVNNFNQKISASLQQFVLECLKFTFLPRGKK
jgi:hypothetical protein